MSQTGAKMNHWYCRKCGQHSDSHHMQPLIYAKLDYIISNFIEEKVINIKRDHFLPEDQGAKLP